MTNFDLTPLLRSTVGFDRMTRMLESGLAGENGAGYPPYNIVKHGEDAYGISMAVAGFGEDDIEITAQENALVVTGHKAEKTDEEEDVTYLHRGIAERAFERRFQLADYITVTGARLENGMLHIDLVRELPERMKARTIEIVSADKVIEQKTDKSGKGSKSKAA